MNTDNFIARPSYWELLHAKNAVLEAGATGL
jgi:hypothetical protein